MTFVVRPAEIPDVERLAQLHVSTWQETYSHLLPAGFFDDAHTAMRRRMWTRILSDPRGDWTIRIAEVDGRAVGFAMSGPSVATGEQRPPRELQLFSLYVCASEHGTGIGQALLDETLGVDPAVLWVARQNSRAVAFYRRNGFEFDGTEKIDPTAPMITDARMIR
jgi:ribosomal protein S18 acetylase RimI-like enzyme